MAGGQTWWEIVWLWSTEWQSFLVAEARAGPQLREWKEQPSRIQVSQGWWVGVGVLLWDEAWNTGNRTAVRWPPGPDQGCEVTKRQCILDGKLGQSATRCYPIHAPWMDHATGKSKSKIQHDIWNQKEKSRLKYFFSSLSWWLTKLNTVCSKGEMLKEPSSLSQSR